VLVLLIGSTFSDVNVEWYVSLNKPYHPPYWIYISAWAVLFVLIAISAIIVLNKQTLEKKKCVLAIPLYLINAVLNALYSVVFFGFKAPTVAFFEITFLIASIMLMTWCNYKISKTAAYLLIPYLLWSIYALVLNGLILFNN